MDRELKAALDDLRSIVMGTENTCLYCKHYRECEGEKCDRYESCNADYLTDCEKLEKTPCNGCHYRSHWEWRGVKDEA